MVLHVGFPPNSFPSGQYEFFLQFQSTELTWECQVPTQNPCSFGKYEEKGSKTIIYVEGLFKASGQGQGLDFVFESILGDTPTTRMEIGGPEKLTLRIAQATLNVAKLDYTSPYTWKDDCTVCRDGEHHAELEFTYPEFGDPPSPHP